MNNMKNKFLVPLLFLTFPFSASAQQFGGVKTLITSFGDIVVTLTKIVAGIALLVFFWGLVKFIYTTSQEGKAEGKIFMVWGIIALFVMVSVWGIILFLQQQLNIHAGLPFVVPTFPRP